MDNLAQPQWSKDNFTEFLDEFVDLYKNRPVRDNPNGTKFPNLFGLFVILKKVQPELVIESGVYKGQSTWLIERTLPNARIVSIDINLDQREFISKTVEYSNTDFKFQDFSNIPENALVFFDDHQNCIDRIQQCKWFGFKNIVFDDNYPIGMGDCYSLKHVKSLDGFRRGVNFLGRIKAFILFIYSHVSQMINKEQVIFPDLYRWRISDVKGNSVDSKMVEKNLATYFEFPPLIMPKDNRFVLEDAILGNDDDLTNYTMAVEEAESYNYITFVQLK